MSKLSTKPINFFLYIKKIGQNNIVFISSFLFKKEKLRLPQVLSHVNLMSGFTTISYTTILGKLLIYSFKLYLGSHYVTSLYFFIRKNMFRRHNHI